MLDTDSYELKPHFAACFDVIDRTLAAGGRVLVHCQQGRSRSGSVVIAYVMRTQRLAFEQAFEFVKARRSVCSPNPGFRLQLAREQEFIWSLAGSRPRTLSRHSKH